MRKYLLYVLIISFVLLLAPTAHVALHAGELEDAKEEVRKNPDDAKAHYDLGNAYCELDKYREAIKSFKRAIWIEPEYAAAHNNLGGAHYLMFYKFSWNQSFKQRCTKSAIKSFKHAIRIDPDFARAHYGLGLCYIRNKDKSSALKQHKILKKLDTKTAKDLLGKIYTELD